MSKLNYSDFFISKKEKECEEQPTKKHQLINKFIKDNNFIKLKNEYYSMDSYSCDKTTKNIYNIIKCNKNIIPNFEIVDENIIKLNNLSINK